MKDKIKLTDKLKKIETVVHGKKVDLNSINLKLESAYDYEEELTKRMVWAKENTEKLRIDFIKKSREVSDEYSKMKQVLDIFTGNFYSN